MVALNSTSRDFLTTFSTPNSRLDPIPISLQHDEDETAGWSLRGHGMVRLYLVDGTSARVGDDTEKERSCSLYKMTWMDSDSILDRYIDSLVLKCGLSFYWSRLLYQWKGS